MSAMPPSEIALDLVGKVSGALNTRDAMLRLLTACRQVARAEAGAILRHRPLQGTTEIVVTDGKPVRREFLFSSFLSDPKIMAQEVSYEETTFLFERSAAAANLEVRPGAPGASVAVVHLEWDDSTLLARETLKQLRDALGYVAPLLDHFKRYDSRVSITPTAGSDLALEEIDLELDTPAFAELFKRLYLLLGTRAKLEAAIFFLFDEKRQAVVEHGCVFGRVGDVPERITREDPLGVVLSLLQDATPRAVRDGPTEWRGSFLAPFLAKQEPIGGAILRAAEGEKFRESEIQSLEEVLDAASLHVQKAILYHDSKRLNPASPLLLVGVPRDVLYLAESYGDADAPVLIKGETGTGKESVARYVHSIGRRRRGPFVGFNCAELVENLAESQLFGHVRGSFTGAVSDTVGIFEQAAGGTLFLDEIHMLTTALQAKFLRAIETGEIRPVGYAGPTKRPDVRIVVATNKDLEMLVQETKFLPDLWMRLNVLELTLPSLRDNRRSLLRIAAALLCEACERHRRTIDGLTPRVRQALLKHDFPGNIRELKNLIEKAVLTTSGTQIDVDGLPKKIVETAGTAEAPQEDFVYDFEQFKSNMERQYVVRLLTRTQGNVAEAARLAGIHRTHIYNLLKKHGLTSEAFKP